jgi:NADH-quinone oxidoreductase subunit L
VGAFGAGIYHLWTHAFFKALLFLGAGSVIHALGEQDLRKMGGLRRKTPITFWTLLAAAVSIAGVPFTAGFFSKDEILLAAYHHAPWMYWVGTFTAGLTAFYVFRAIFLAFLGRPRGWHHAHESPPVMTVPLMLLAILSLVGGLAPVSRFLAPMFPVHAVGHETHLVAISVGAGLAGIALAWLFYVARCSARWSMARATSCGGKWTLTGLTGRSTDWARAPAPPAARCAASNPAICAATRPGSCWDRC